MSAQHHESNEAERTINSELLKELDVKTRMIEEMMGQAKPRFPQGKITEDDQGEITFAVAADRNKGVVILRFGKPVDWLGLDAEHARHLGNILIEKANQL